MLSPIFVERPAPSLPIKPPSTALALVLLSAHKMPPILQPVMRVFEPMMYIFNFLLELKPSLQPPLQPPPQLVQPLRPVTLKEVSP